MAQLTSPPRRFQIRDGLAIVTGAASGIGAALASNLARRGCDLALVDRQGDALEAVGTELRKLGVKVTVHAVDIAAADAVASLQQAVITEHGRVTVLVNNAGISAYGNFEQISATDFELIININFIGAVRMTRAFLPALKAAPAAQLVYLSSAFGIAAPPGHTAYAASKFAIRGFGEALRHEFAGTPLGVTVVHPGGVRTAITRNARRSPMLSEDEIKMIDERSARLLRLSPEDAAEIIARGIERRAPRVLVGSDARCMSALQWLFPVHYWSVAEHFMP